MSHSYRNGTIVAYKALVKLGKGEGAKLGEGEGAKLGEGGRSCQVSPAQRLG